ncbi:hypothetical protein MNV49_006597 [Pseudohyphozyma bogoriensis]|nr:hypothetical protein MNV49_006597 [Pseudohyphozyma bogoriensis]
MPIPQIPDLRHEQSVLASIRPFIHRVEAEEDEGLAAEVEEAGGKQERKEKRVKAEEKGAVVSNDLTAEGKPGGGPPDIFTGPVRIEWAQVAYIIARDQILWPLLHGLAWGAGGILWTSAWRGYWSEPKTAPSRAGFGTRSSPFAMLARKLGLSK